MKVLDLPGCQGFVVVVQCELPSLADDPLGKKAADERPRWRYRAKLDQKIGSEVEMSAAHSPGDVG